MRMVVILIAAFRQEKLERLAERFEKKAVLRETWLSDMTKVHALYLIRYTPLAIIITD